MSSKIKKTGRAPIGFWVAGALLLAALWGVRKYVIYRPQVLSSSPLKRIPGFNTDPDFGANIAQCVHWSL
jgi:hypothetical protein